MKRRNPINSVTHDMPDRVDDIIFDKLVRCKTEKFNDYWLERKKTSVLTKKMYITTLLKKAYILCHES